MAQHEIKCSTRFSAARAPAGVHKNCRGMFIGERVTPRSSRQESSRNDGTFYDEDALPSVTSTMALCKIATILVNS